MSLKAFHIFFVAISTLLTLFVIPAFYWLLARGTSSPEAVTRRLEEQLSDRTAGTQPAE